MSTSDIQNINNIKFLSPINRYQQISQAESKIKEIDKEVNARNQYISSIDTNIIARKEYIKTLLESRDLGYKRMALLEDTNKKLIYLLDSRGIKHNAKSVELEPSIKEHLKDLEKKQNVLKEKSFNVDKKLDKLTLKLEQSEKQIAHARVVTNIFNEYVPTYKPNDLKITSMEKSTKSDEELKLQVYRSQKNLYDSIVSKYVKNNIIK